MPLPLGLPVTLQLLCFFVISGFALSFPVLTSPRRYRTLRNMAVFRYFRLSIPVVVSCLIAYGLWRLGAYSNKAAGLAAGSPWFSQWYGADTPMPMVLRFSLFDVY